MLDEQLLSTLTVKDKLFVLLFRYNKNINMRRDKIENEVAVYGSVLMFITYANITFVYMFEEEFYNKYRDDFLNWNFCNDVCIEDEECIESIRKDLGPEYCQKQENESIVADKELLVILCKIMKLMLTLRYKQNGNSLDYIYILLVGHIRNNVDANIPFPDANNHMHGMPRTLQEYLEIMHILSEPPTASPPATLTKYNEFIKTHSMC